MSTWVVSMSWLYLLCCCVWLLVTLWTTAHWAPLPMEFSRQEYWSGKYCHFLLEEIFLTLRSNTASLVSPAFAGRFFRTSATWEAQSHLYVFFREMSIQVFCPLFFFLMLSCMSCLYILAINPLLVKLFANIFSHSIGCLFTLFMASLLYKSFQIYLGSICLFLLLFLLPLGTDPR